MQLTLQRTVRRTGAMSLLVLACFNLAPQELPGQGVLTGRTPTRFEVQLAAEQMIVVPDPRSDQVAIREDASDPRRVRTTRTGAPDLGMRVVNVLLPPDADLDTVQFTVHRHRTRFLGRFNVRPGPRVTGFDSDSGQYLDPNADLQLDPEGRDVTIYEKNAPWPRSAFRSLETGRFQELRYVRILFSPFHWNPVTQRLRTVTRMDLAISWQRDPLESGSSFPSEFVQQLFPSLHFYNPWSLTSWYALESELRAAVGYDYLILTSKSVISGSSVLDDFEAHKRGLGYRVVTTAVEDVYTLFPAIDPADSIREFLEEARSQWGINYVLLIGDPDPYDPTDSFGGVGGVPMKILWVDGAANYDGEYPTDFYYGDLTGNWDADGDGWAGEYDDDLLSFDFCAELLVGRIPFDEISSIDPVLSRTIDYEIASTSPPSWRRMSLLACSFLDGSTDSAFMGEDIFWDLLVPAGMPGVRYYQKASVFSPTDILTDGIVPPEWSSWRPGLVVVRGHGSSSRMRVGYKDNYDGDLINKSDLSLLDPTAPAFVIQVSCSTAKPEDSDNLTHRMIQEHAATDIAATRTSFYVIGQTDHGDKTDSGSIAYRLADNYAAKRQAGVALWLTRWFLADTSRAWHVKNLLTYNLYGDPSLGFEY